MPAVSEAQRRWAFAKKDEDTKEGRAAAKFAAADKGGKLPEHVKDGKSHDERRYPRMKS